MTYKDAGVDIDAGTELVRRIAKMAPGIGGFGGLFPWGKIPPPFFFFSFLRMLFWLPRQSWEKK
jgi:phosphoribosylaminoimidazole (AIR) synthetase